MCDILKNVKGVVNDSCVQKIENLHKDKDVEDVSSMDRVLEPVVYSAVTIGLEPIDNQISTGFLLPSKSIVM